MMERFNDISTTPETTRQSREEAIKTNHGKKVAALLIEMVDGNVALDGAEHETIPETVEEK